MSFGPLGSRPAALAAGPSLELGTSPLGKQTLKTALISMEYTYLEDHGT